MNADPQARKIGKQSSKPLIGVRNPSGSRPASGTSSRQSAKDPKSSHYQGALASNKYNIGSTDIPVNRLPPSRSSKKESENMPSYDDQFNQSSSSFHSVK
jgi:hypothetical protein